MLFCHRVCNSWYIALILVLQQNGLSVSIISSECIPLGRVAASITTKRRFHTNSIYTIARVTCEWYAFFVSIHKFPVLFACQNETDLSSTFGCSVSIHRENVAGKKSYVWCGLLYLADLVQIKTICYSSFFRQSCLFNSVHCLRIPY